MSTENEILKLLDFNDVFDELQKSKAVRSSIQICIRVIILVSICSTSKVFNG
jgi:hypothetical protein